MKLSDQFVLRDICGEYLLVPLGEKTKTYNGVFSLSETGAFIIQKLNDNQDIPVIAQSIAEEFDIDVAAAYEDVSSFIKQLREYGILTD